MLTATHSLYQHQTTAEFAVPLPDTSTQDFTLRNLTKASASPEAFNTLDELVTFNINTTVSYAGSMVQVELFDGTLLPASYVLDYTVPDGWSRWMVVWQPPSDLPEKLHTFHACAVDIAAPRPCTGTQTSALLSQVWSEAFAYDLTPPTITNLIPYDGGNAGSQMQPLFATIRDTSGSGVQISSIAFTLLDSTSGSTSQFAGAAISYDSDTAIAKTSATPLIAGHIYRLTVTAADLAGNTISVSHREVDVGGGFLATTFSGASSSAAIPASPCTVSSSVGPDGQRETICRDVPLHVAATTATLSGTRKIGEAAVIQTVQLSTAVFRTTIDGTTVTVPAPIPDDPTWQAQSAPMRFEIASATSSSASYEVPQVNYRLGTLMGKVPAAWSSATLLMTPVATVAATPVCADPTQSENCFVDPVLSVPWRVWDPPALPDHNEVCDQAISHTVQYLITPGVSHTVRLHVDRAKLIPTSLSLKYQVGVTGSPQTLTQAGTEASDYFFTIPSGALISGQDVRYAFVASGVFSNPDCQSVTGAVAPVSHSFVSGVATQANKDDVKKFASDSLFTTAEQPGRNIEMPGQTLCDLGDFESPNPCDLYPVHVFEGSGPTGGAPESGTLEAAATAGTGTRCVMTETNGPTWRDFPYKFEDSSGFFSTAQTLQREDLSSSYNSVFQSTYADTNWINGSPTAIGEAETGFYLHNVGGTLPIRVDLEWELRGTMESYVGPRTCSTIFFFVCNAQQADSHASRTVAGLIRTLPSKNQVYKQTIRPELVVASHLTELAPDYRQANPAGAGTWTVARINFPSGAVYTFAALVRNRAHGEVTSGTRAYGLADHENPQTDWRLRSSRLVLTALDGFKWVQCLGGVIEP